MWHCLMETIKASSRVTITARRTIASLVFAVGMAASMGELNAQGVRAEVLSPEVLEPASERFRFLDSRDVPDFQRHVVPLLGRLGCNSAKCHGSFQGQGDFRLSLFGFDFQSDHAQLHAEASSEEGSRLNPSRPNGSLLLRKPTEQTDHEGGKRFEAGSWEHHLLRRWIETGGNGVSTINENGNEASRHQSESSESDGQFFTESIQPIFEDHCHECHANSSRKGDFSLASREAILAGGKSGAAIVPGQPDRSLLIEAVRYGNDDLQMPPSGKLAAKEIEAIEKWIRLGAPWPDGYDNAPGDTDQVLAELHYDPKEIVFGEQHATQQIKVIAEWEDGSREDVTCLARFQSNNDAVVEIDCDGRATSTGQGDTHIIAFYDNGVASITVLRPVANSVDVATDAVRARATDADTHPVDQFVNAKLRKLRITPSEICTDAEFLRRVSIDMIGTLPTPDEVVSFLRDFSDDKRERKIEELLERPGYAAWWANKLCDFTGCNPASISSLLEVARQDGIIKATQWYDWIYQRVERNEPYDELVAGIMLSDLRGRGDTQDDGMPFFWTRQSLKEPKDAAMSVAHAFLGIQLQCAECHKHPFDRWTQADFNDFAKFFDSVTKSRRTTIRDQQELRLLRSENVQLRPGDDPREPIMSWMRDSQNPWFARAFVNRVWAGYFNVGIVDPPDQFTPANPPSNPQLLDWLTDQFIANNYDMKWLHRQIASSQTYQQSWKPNATNRHDRRNFSRAIPRRIPAEVVYDAMKQATAGSDQQQEVRTNMRRRASGHLSMRMAGTHAMKVFGKPDRSINCDCERVNEPTLLQAIFTQNDPLVRMHIADSNWIIEIEDTELDGQQLEAKPLIEQVWLRTVARYPNESEHKRAMECLAAADSQAEGVGDLLWAMMNTKEFLLNH